MKNFKLANDSGSLISTSTTCLLQSSEVREYCSANNHRKSSKNSRKSYSIHGGKGWVQTMQKTQTTGILKETPRTTHTMGWGQLWIDPSSHHKELYSIRPLFSALSSAYPSHYGPVPNFSLAWAIKKTENSKENHTDWISLYELLVPPSGSRHFNRKKGFLTWFMCKSQHLNLKSLRCLHNHLWMWAWLGFKVLCLGAKGHLLCI